MFFRVVSSVVGLDQVHFLRLWMLPNRQNSGQRRLKISCCCSWCSGYFQEENNIFILSDTRKLFCLNFVIMMCNLIKQRESGWKMALFAYKIGHQSSLFLAWYFLCHWDEGFAEKWKISDALCTFCPNSPVYAALLSYRWCQYKLISSLCQQQSVCKRHRQSARARAETDQFTLLQLSLQPFGLSSNWT